VGTNGVDTVDAKSGADFVYGYGGDDNLAGGSGTDSIYGGAGNDTIDGGQDTDTIYGGSGDDFIKGGSEIDTIYGGSGNDTIQGDAANDVIIGGFGADLLTGNAGNDTFRFLDIRDTGDTIVGFASGDKIDLSSIDADPSTANDTFGFAGNTSTLAAHSVNWFFNDNGTAANTADDFTVIQVDTDGNIGTAEMEIHLIGTISLVTGDFLP
jgi:Ca2+-binding RTX toxin-like protein